MSAITASNALVMTCDFDAPAEAVFAALEDHANMGRWLRAKITVVKTVEGGIGSVRRVHLGLSSLDEEIVESVPSTRIVYRIVRGLFPLSYHRGEINLTPLGDKGCRVVWTIAIDSKIPFLAAIVRGALNLVIGSGLRRLNRQLAR